MGFFFNTKPKATKEEFQKVRNYLYSMGFTHKELERRGERRPESSSQHEDAPHTHIPAGEGRLPAER